MVLQTRRLWLPVLAGVGFLLSAGCGGRVQKKLTLAHPAKGKVLVSGKPFQGLSVRLYDRSLQSASTTGVVAFGLTGAEGEFILEPNAKGADTPAGEYVITVSYDPPATNVIDELEGRSVTEAPRIDRGYADPLKSPLHVQIAPVSSGESFEIPTILLP